MKKPKKVVQGSTSAGKTYGIIPILIDTAAKRPRIDITVVAESIPAVKDGAVKIFKEVMFDTNRWVEERWLGNPMQYEFGNKTTVKFRSFDTIGKASAAGKREVLFLNEGNNIPFEIADALMIRSEETWIDFNPVAEFWAHTEVLTEPNSEHLILTYKDNEAIPPATLENLLIKLKKAYYDTTGNYHKKENIKNAYWANWCQVYLFGQIGSLQGTVFTNWSQVDDLPMYVDSKGELKLAATLVARGLDFGFVKPAALIDVYIYKGELYLDERIYETKLTNANLIDKFVAIGVDKYTEIIADCAEPKSITDLENAGYYITPAYKPKDGIPTGIKILQQYKINVTSRSLNLIKELRNYKWAKKTDGTELEVPVKYLDHLLDALRYVALAKLSLYAEGSGRYPGLDDEDDGFNL